MFFFDIVLANIGPLKGNNLFVMSSLIKYFIFTTNLFYKINF